MKNKWLIGIATAAMAVTLSLGLVACGGGGDDPETNNAKGAINVVKNLYSGGSEDTIRDYKVVGKATFGGQFYPVEWTVAPRDEITVEQLAAHVEVGELDTSDNQVTIKITPDLTLDVPYTLTATINDGTHTESTSFNRRVPHNPMIDCDEQYDFTETVTWTGIGLNAASALGEFKKAGPAEDAQLVDITSLTNVSAGSDGGDYLGMGGVLKFGTGSNNGVLELEFKKKVAKIVILEQAWNSNATDTIVVEGAEEEAVQMNAGSAGAVEFNLTNPSEKVRITTEKRGFVLGLGVKFATDVHNHELTYEHIEGTFTHKVRCTVDGCTEYATEQTVDCVPFRNDCRCGYTYQEEEILEAFFALASGASLKGTYELTGTLTFFVGDGIQTGQYKNATFMMQVGTHEFEVYRAYGEGYENLKEGDTVTVYGTLKRYNSTFEFDTGSVITSIIDNSASMSDQEKAEADKNALKLDKNKLTSATDTIDLPTTGIYGSTIAWSVDENDYIKIENNQVVVKSIPTSGSQEITIKATITCGTAGSDEATFTITVKNAALTGKGTADEPYTVDDAITIGEGLSASGTAYYMKDGDTTPTKIYIHGFVTNIGTVNEYKGEVKGLQNVLIASTAGGSDTLKLSFVYYDDTVMVMQGDGKTNPLTVGDEVTVYGYLERYNGGDASVYYSSGDYPTFTSWEKANVTGEAAAQAALDKIELPSSIKVETALPALQGVTITYVSDNTSALEIAEDYSKMIPHRAATDVTVHVTVTVSVDGAQKSKTVDVTVEKLAEIPEGNYTWDFDFTDFADYVSAWNATTNSKITDKTAMAAYLNDLTAEYDLVKEVQEITNVYGGQGGGGAHANALDILKFGTGSATGKLVIVFEKPVNKLVINAEGWTSTSNTTSDTFTVNGGTAQNLTLSATDYTFEFDPTTTVTIESANRLLIWSMTITVGGAEKSPEDKITAAKEALTTNNNLFATNYDKIGSYDLPTLNSGATLAWAIKSGAPADGIVSVNGGKLVIDNLPSEQATLKMECTISCTGTDTTEKVEKDFTVSAGPTLTNTGADKDNAYTVAEALTIKNYLSVGAYWGGTTAKKVYVAGYVVSVGTVGSSKTEYYASNVTIADEVGGSTTLLIYSFNYAEGILEDNAEHTVRIEAGDHIVVYGYLQLFKENVYEVNRNADYDFPVIAKYTKRAATDEEMQEALTEALQSVQATRTVKVAGDVTLETSTVENVAFAWTVKDSAALPENVTLESGVLKVTQLPGEQKVVTLVCTATYGEGKKSDTKEVTVTIEKKPESAQEKAQHAAEELVKKITDGTDSDHVKEINEVKEYTLPTENEQNGTATWTIETQDVSQYVEIKDDNKTLNVKELPIGEDVTVQLKVSVEVDGSSATATVTITLKGQELPTTTASTTIEAYATAHGWELDSKYGEVVLDNNIKATTNTGTNNGKYLKDSSSNHLNVPEWRLYSSEKGVLTITALNEATIKTVKITYIISDSGYLEYSGAKVTSDQVVEVNAASAAFTVKTGKTWITAIEVEYTGGIEWTDEQKITDALAEIEITATDLVVDLPLPKTTVPGVTLKWSVTVGSDAAQVTGSDVEGYTLHITRGEKDVPVTLKVSASCGDAVAQEKEFNQLIVKAQATEGPVILSFDLSTEPGPAKDNLSSSAFETWLKSYASDAGVYASKIESVTCQSGTTRVSTQAGGIKLGASKGTGEFTIAFKSSVEKIAITWETYSGDSGYLVVNTLNGNGGSKQTTATEEMFEFSEPTTSISVSSSAKRINISAIKIYFA